MPKILGLTPGKNVPSSRFRVSQYKSELAKHNLQLTEAHSPIPYDYKLPGLLGKTRQRYILPISGALLLTKISARIPQIIQSYNYDIVWLNRPLIDNIALERFLHKPLVFDADDAVWLNGSKHITKITERSDTIFAGNSYIADWFCRHNKNVEIIPTAIDTDKFKPSEKKDDFFNVVWTGSKQTEHYLLSIEKSLFKFTELYKDVKLIVVSNKMPEFKFIKPNKIDFIKWNPFIESSVLQKADVGIMPLFDTEWEKGKCSFKMLQYMATGLPVIVSPVGMNKEVLLKKELGLSPNTENEWVDMLAFIYNNREKAKVLGNNGRSVILNEYSVSKVTEKIIKVFNKLT